MSRLSIFRSYASEVRVDRGERERDGGMRDERDLWAGENFILVLS